jgi:membrane-bound serine protease (ClpP class)
MGLAVIGMWVLNKYLPHMPGANRMFLNAPKPATAGGASAQFGLPPMGAEAVVRLGDSGRTVTRLRPAGKASLNGRRIDVIAQGQMIDEDRLVEVVEVSGARIVVREVRQA